MITPRRNVGSYMSEGRVLCDIDPVHLMMKRASSSESSSEDTNNNKIGNDDQDTRLTNGVQAYYVKQSIHVS